ncbi:MAG: DMT family transporter [Candidatus Heimdallarchaeota archaeon]
MADLNLLWAIIAQLCSTSLNYIGMTIQKKAANELPKIGLEAGLIKSVKNFLLKKEWILGYGLNGISVILNAIALALAAMSIIQPLYGFGLIVLVIFSHFYLKEKITRIDILGVLIGIAGIITIGLTAVQPETLSYTDLLTKFFDIRGIIFLSVFLGLAIILYLISEKITRNISVVLLTISSSIWTATSFLFYKAIASAVRDLGFVSAFFGEGWLYTWSFFGLIALVSAIGLVMLNIAYQNGQCVIVVPVWSSLQVVLPILAGIIVFGEWANFSANTITGQTIGIVIMLASLIILSVSNGKKEDSCNLLQKESNEKEELIILETPNSSLEEPLNES